MGIAHYSPELLDSCDPPNSASQVVGIIGMFCMNVMGLANHLLFGFKAWYIDRIHLKSYGWIGHKALGENLL